MVWHNNEQIIINWGVFYSQGAASSMAMAAVELLCDDDDDAAALDEVEGTIGCTTTVPVCVIVTWGKLLGVLPGLAVGVVAALAPVITVNDGILPTTTGV
jgi:hypothetical protein